MLTTPIKVFISATTKDLGACRLAARDLLLTHDIQPVLQDHFPPDHRDLVEYLRNRVGSCAGVVCLVGMIHGASPSGATASRSYTQIEYDVARELNIPVYVFQTGEHFTPDNIVAEPTELVRAQERHRKALLDAHTCRFFSTCDELRTQLTDAVPALKLLGGRQRMQYPHLQSLPAYFTGRRRELAELHGAMRKAVPAPIVVLGMGGQGKTTLLRQALEEMNTEEFPFANGWWWSAYRGGFTFDNFVDEALGRLLEGTYDKRSMPDIDTRVSRLLVELQNRPFLVVIDGIEHWLRGWNIGARNLESAETDEQRLGHYPGLDVFLESVAGLSNGTHVAITTRALPTVLEQRACSIVPVRDPGEPMGLDGLDSDDAVALLRRFGVEGSDEDLRAAATGFANHPLALEVLAGFLVKKKRGLIGHAPTLNVLNPKGRLFQLLDLTQQRLPGRTHARKLLQAASHFIEDPPLDLVASLMARFGVVPTAMRWLRSPLPWWRSLLPTVSGKQVRALEELVVTLSDWNLLDWDGHRKVIKLHLLIKEFFSAGNAYSRRLDLDLSQIYFDMPIPEGASTLKDARPRLLAMEHALRAGDADRSAALFFSRFVDERAFVEWLSSWGHQTTAIDLLGRIAEKCSPHLRPQLINARGAMHWQLGQHAQALQQLDNAVDLARQLSVRDQFGKVSVLTSALNNRANVRRDLRQFTEAKEDFTEAISLLAPLAPQSGRHRQELARIKTNRGNVWRDMGSLSRAIADYEAALSEYERINPNHFAGITSMATLVRLNRAIAIADRWDHAAANPQFEQCLADFENLVRAGQIEFESTLAYTRVMYGATLNDAGQHQQATEMIDCGLSALQSFVERGRHDLDDKFALAHLDKAHALVNAARWEHADAHSATAVRLFTQMYRDGRYDVEGHLGHALMIRSEALLGGRKSAEAYEARREGLEHLRRLVDRNATDVAAVYLRTSASSVVFLARLERDTVSVSEGLNEILRFGEVELRREAPLETVLLEMNRSLGKIERELPDGFADEETMRRIFSLRDRAKQAYNRLGLEFPLPAS